ncbi:MAG: DUF6263 family protein [Planctomycetota bacterium]
MKRVAFVCSGLLIALLAVVPTATAEPQITLAFNLEPGQTFTVAMVARQDIDQKVEGQAIDIDQTIGITSTYEVLDRPSASGGQWMRMTYVRSQFKQTGPMGNIDYDSDRPQAEIPMMARGFAGLVNQSLLVEIAPDGEVVKVEGIDALIDKMVNALGLPEGPAKDAARQATKQQLNPESLKQMMAFSGGVYPGKPVAIGDTWDDQQSLSGIVPMIIDSTYTLTGFDDDTASLSVKGQISPQPDAEAFKVDQTQMMTKMNGTQVGRVVLDRKTGWVLSSEITQEIQCEMTVRPPQGDPVKIDMVITGTTSLNVVD